MNKLPNEAIKFIEDLSSEYEFKDTEVVICPPFIDLFYSLLTVQGTKIKVGAQNMHWENSGAYTGEVAPNMLKSINVEYVIIGHSERRQYYNESDEDVAKKVKSALEEGLKPIVCVGETLEQRENGQATEIITNQTKEALKLLNNEDISKVIIAYEPIWAIGTGKTATPDDANESIKSIRGKIREIYGEAIAEEVTIQYGGSVKPDNAKELFNMSDIDGALVGGASLKVEDFIEIINAMDERNKNNE